MADALDGTISLRRTPGVLWRLKLWSSPINRIFADIQRPCYGGRLLSWLRDSTTDYAIHVRCSSDPTLHDCNPGPIGLSARVFDTKLGSVLLRRRHEQFHAQ